MSLPNEIFTVSIVTTTEGGEEEPYFGVCIPNGWTIPGDSIQCSGEYSGVIYYNDSLSTEQENASPTTDKYYWWVGKGVADTGAVGVVYSDLQIQTDSQVGLFSIDYMLGNGYNGVNHQRSDGHLIQITENATITSVVPDQGYQNFTIDIGINGFNTHFADGPGTENVWLSQNGNEIYANSFVVYSNTSLTAIFYIPVTASVGLWNVNVETFKDSIITRVEGFEILPPPPLIFVSPDLLEMELEPGSTGAKTLTISNTGGSDLHFNIIGPNSAVQFDGVDDYIKIDSFDLTYDFLTVESWVFLEDNSEIREVIDNTDMDFQLEIWQDLRIMFDALGEGSRLTSDPGVMPLNQWVHLAGVYDGTFSIIYLNGIQVAQRNLAGSVNRTNTTIHIGTETNAIDQFWKGIIDEVRLWDQARTDIQIQQNMYREISGIEPGLIGYWKFNEGIGDTAYDKSPYGNHGILQGGAVWSDSSAPILSLPDWLYLTTGSGICNPNTAIDIPVTFDAIELDTGDYNFSLTIFSNDPFHPQVTIPVHMLVSNTVSVEDELTLPTEFRLEQNYPNPFNPSTTIQYGIKERSSVELILYDILGREVKVLVNEEQDAGYYKINFNAKSLASGIYFYRIQAGKFIETKKMILLK
jgi:hypothetical protein